MNQVSETNVTNSHSNNDVIVRSEGMSGSTFLRLTGNNNVKAIEGNTYSFIDPNTFEEVEVSFAKQDGDALVVTLVDGRTIIIQGFYDLSEENKFYRLAQLSDNSKLNDQTGFFGYDTNSAEVKDDFKGVSFTTTTDSDPFDEFVFGSQPLNFSTSGHLNDPSNVFDGSAFSSNMGVYDGFSQINNGYANGPFGSAGGFANHPSNVFDGSAFSSNMGVYDGFSQINNGYANGPFGSGASYGSSATNPIYRFGSYALAGLTGFVLATAFEGNNSFSNSTDSSNNDGNNNDENDKKESEKDSDIEAIEKKLEDVAQNISEELLELSQNLDDVSTEVSSNFVAVENKLEDFVQNISEELVELSQKLDEVDSGVSVDFEALEKTLRDHFEKLPDELNDLVGPLSEKVDEVFQKIDDISAEIGDQTQNNGLAEGLQALVQSLITMVGSLSQSAAGTPLTINNITGSENVIGAGGGSSIETTDPEDNLAPNILSVTAPNNVDAIMMGDLGYIDIKFSEAILLNGDGMDLALTLSNGQTANYNQQPEKDILRFSFLAQEPQSDLLTVSQLTSSTTTLTDSAGNNANTIITDQVSQLYSIEELKIETIEHNFPENGVLTLENYLEEYFIDLKYSSVVKVDTNEASPYLILNSGSDAIAQFVSGSGTDTLRFKYIVGEGEVATPLKLNGLVDNNTISSLSGVIAKPYTNELFVTDVVIDTKKPSVVDFEIIDEVLGTDVIDVGTEQYLTYTSTVRLTLDEAVFWAVSEGAVFEDLPYLEVNGVVNDLETEDSARAIFSLDNLSGSDFIDFEVTGYVNKYIYDNGEVAPLQIFTTPNVNAIDSRGNPLDTSIQAGAGRFLLGSYDLTKIEKSQNESQIYDDGYTVWHLTDLNGFAGNYIDEVSGKLLDLSTQMLPGKYLRTVSFNDTISSKLVATPLSEFAIRIVEALEYDLSDPKALSLYEAISQSFGIENIFEENLAFANDESVENLDVNASAYNYAIALSALSALDSVTGSVDLTLDILKTMFFEGPFNYTELFDAARKNVLDASTLNDPMKLATVDMISAIQEMAADYSRGIILANDLEETNTIIEDDINDFVLEFSDGSVLDFSEEMLMLNEASENSQELVSIPDHSLFSTEPLDLTFFYDQTSHEREG